MVRNTSVCILALCFVIPVFAQVDQQRAAAYFKEAAVLCERDGGRLWGISLCGPMVIADPITHTLATNQPAPDAKQPATLGFANTAVEWGGTRWSAFAWPLIPHDAHARARLMMHELFHRIQLQLGFMLREGTNEHLDTRDGRYWMRLEWRALARALEATGDERATAIRDALAFRQRRRNLLPAAGEGERVQEMNEGLAQYTGTVTSVATPAEATADAVEQLRKAGDAQSFVRTFAYPSGAAYGLLLDAAAPGWPRRVKPTDDLGQMLMRAMKLEPATDAQAAAARYGGPELMKAEVTREKEQNARVAELRHRFVEGPVLTLPNPGQFAFATAGMVALPQAGTVYPTFRANAPWGTLEADQVLVAPDFSKVTVPAPANVQGSTLSGQGWKLTLAPGWVAEPGARAGDFKVVRQQTEAAAGR